MAKCDYVFKILLYKHPFYLEYIQNLDNCCSVFDSTSSLLPNSCPLLPPHPHSSPDSLNQGWLLSDIIMSLSNRVSGAVQNLLCLNAQPFTTTKQVKVMDYVVNMLNQGKIIYSVWIYHMYHSCGCMLK